MNIRMLAGCSLIFLCLGILTNSAFETEVRSDKFIVPELEKFMLVDSDMPGYSLRAQHKSYWPIAKIGKEVHEKIAVEQRWVSPAGREVSISYGAFESPQEAGDAAGFYVSFMHWPFKEGTFTEARLGDRSWISSQSQGAALMVVRGKVVVLIGDALCKKDERKKLEEIALKALVRIDQVTEGETLGKGHYVLKRTPVPEIFVTGINVTVLARRHLQDFNFVRQRMMWNWGRRYVFLRPSDGKKVEITVAVYSSVEETEENVLDALMDMAAIGKKGTASGIVIGENCWFLRTGHPSAGAIVFIRKNVLVRVFSSDYELAEVIARKIDDDIMAGANGVKTGKTVSPPLIKEISAPAKAKKGEPTKIVINAADPADEKLSYAVIPSSGKISGTEIEDRKVFIAETSGIYEISICVANESNVFSRVTTLQVIVE